MFVTASSHHGETEKLDDWEGGEITVEEGREKLRGRGGGKTRKIRRRIKI
jgi:hypothetical protein